MPPQRGESLLPSPPSSISPSNSTVGIFTTGSLSVKSPDGIHEYQVVEDWPRRSDASGDTYRAVKRDANSASESIVALKVAKIRNGGGGGGGGGGLLSGSSSSSNSNEPSTTQIWDQEVRLLRRLALLSPKSKASTTTTTSSTTQRASSSNFTIEMVTEFGGIRALPSARFLVTTPCCWKSLDTRIKGVERGHMEPYTPAQALQWCWQITRGLWELQEADIGYANFSLRHCLLTAPEGEIRLAGFDTHFADVSEGGSDTREGLWNLGRVLHMTLSCSTDREDDRDYFKMGRARGITEGGGSNTITGHEGTHTHTGRRGALLASSSFSTPSLFSPRPFLAAIPVPVRPIVLGLLATTPSTALPLGLALDQLGELIGKCFTKDYSLQKGGSASSSSLRALEEQWWGLVRQLEEGEQQQSQHLGVGGGGGVYGGGGGVAESKSSCGATRLEMTIELAQACLELGREWEQEGKGYRAIEYLRDAAGLVEGDAKWKGNLLVEAWGRIADIHQSRGNHAQALEELKRLAVVCETDLKECQRRAAAAAASATQDGGQEAWQTAISRQMHEDIAARLADVRVRMAASLREVGDTRGAMAQLNSAQHELEEAGAESGLGIVRVLTGKAAMYTQRKDYLPALEMYEDALERRRKAVPREDPELASLLVGMAEVYAQKGDTDVALTMLIQAYKRMSEGSSRVGGSGAAVRSPTSSASTSTTASASSSSSSSSSPSSLSSSSYSTTTNNNTTTTTTRNNNNNNHNPQERDLLVMASALERIGSLFFQKNQLDDALMCFKAAHERKATALARAHPSVASSLASMASIHEKKGDYRAAATMHARTLEIRRAVLSPTHTDIATSLFGLGNAHQRLRASKSALLAYEEAETIRRIHGVSVALGDVLVNSSRPLKALKRDAEAVSKLREAREVYQMAGVKAQDVRMCTVNDNLKVLGALIQKGNGGMSVGGGGGGGGGGRRSNSDSKLRLGREGLLLHHAAATTTNGAGAANTQGAATALGGRSSSSTFTVGGNGSNNKRRQQHQRARGGNGSGDSCVIM